MKEQRRTLAQDTGADVTPVFDKGSNSQDNREGPAPRRREQDLDAMLDVLVAEVRSRNPGT